MKYACNLTSPCQKLVSSGCNADLGGCRKSPTLPLTYCWRSAGTSRPRPMASGEPRQPLPGSSLLCILLQRRGRQFRARKGSQGSQSHAACLALQHLGCPHGVAEPESRECSSACCPRGGSMLQVAHSGPAATLVATCCRAGWQHSQQSKPAAVVQVAPCQSRIHSPGVDSLCQLLLAATPSTLHSSKKEARVLA